MTLANNCTNYICYSKHKIYDLINALGDAINQHVSVKGSQLVDVTMVHCSSVQWVGMLVSAVWYMLIMYLVCSLPILYPEIESGILWIPTPIFRYIVAIFFTLSCAIQ